MSVFWGPMERLERALPSPGSAGSSSAAARALFLPWGSGSCPAPECRGHQPCPAPAKRRAVCQGDETAPLAPRLPRGGPGPAARPRPCEPRVGHGPFLAPPGAAPAPRPARARPFL